MQFESTVYVVDDDQGARESVRALVRSMGIHSEAFASAEAFLENFNPKKPGCLVTDLRMDGMSGVELQDKLAANDVHLPVIIITAHAETPITVKAVKTGAITVLEKPCQDFELFDAIRDALVKDAEFRKSTASLKAFHERLDSLSVAEKEVLDYMMEGMANKVIARRLNVSIRTVENRRQRVFEKTGTDSLAELVRSVVEAKASSHPS